MIMLMNTGGVAMTNSFLVADEAAKQAVLFDAPDHTTEPLLKETAQRGWSLIGLWLTHGHFDHFADAQDPELVAQVGRIPDRRSVQSRQEIANFQAGCGVASATSAVPLSRGFPGWELATRPLA